MWGANDPDCRKPMVWPDLEYDSETYNPDQSRHNGDMVAFNKDLFDWYQKYIGLRQKYKAIQLGTYATLLMDDSKKLYAFSRKYNNEEVIVIVNRSQESIPFNHAVLKDGAFKNVFTKALAKQLQVPPMEIVVVSNR
jgi:cyclomaltodextrinase / maltogenic alpha-amylase / neopullulanase